MENIELNENSELVFTNGIAYVEKFITKEGEDILLDSCPYCGKILEDLNIDKCPGCHESLKPNSDIIKTFLKQNKLEDCIQMLEENNLLDYDALKKMKESDYKEIGITKIGDRKKLTSIFNSDKKSFGKGCLIPIIITVVIIAAALLILNHFGILAAIGKILSGFIAAGILLILFAYLN